MAIEATKAAAPPSFLGIERRMAYANKKYHSGWICTGVTRGFAGMKFSVSPRRKGLVSTRKISVQSMITNPTRSLNEKYGWNGTLFRLEGVPAGLLDPVWCRNKRWIMVIPATINGSTKWKVKNRVSVALSTANPPQSHCTNICPR